jgi:aromatic-L-amino-acid/L-tryptophan decarboxylase
MHAWEHDQMQRRVSALIQRHLTTEPSLGRTPSRRDVADLAAVTDDGIGIDATLDLVERVILPNNVALDHPNFLAYIPAAPTPSTVLIDALVAAWSFSGESWQEAGGAVAAENAALAWLAELAGLPDGAGGCFVSGGSAGNHSALAVARDRWRRRHGRTWPLSVVCADSAHASVRTAAALLDLDVVTVPGDERGRLTGAALAQVDPTGVCAVVATAGATNTGAVDELDAIADVCATHGWWMHVDGAYGGAGLCVDVLRPQYIGIERADSVVIDPHKWLFSTLDCAALLYREPSQARLTHRQTASYIDAFGEEQWNPSDYAFHLTRRARGIPFWFTLVAHGTDAMAHAVMAGVDLAHEAADHIRSLAPQVRLVMEPQLSVVLFERDDWTREDWDRWADHALADNLAFVAPTTWQGRAVGRLVFLHPDANLDAVRTLLNRIAD